MTTAFIAMEPTSRVTGGRHTSDVLNEIAANANGARVTLGDIVASLGDRGFALLMVVLGLPNVLPMPPPIPLVCGLLLVFIALQIVLGRRLPWLPRRVLAASVARDRLDAALARATPVLRRLERFSSRRLSFMPASWELRGAGLVLLIISIGLVCAAPLIGQIPMGISICLIGLALVERDGVIMAVAVVFGGLGLVFNFGFILAVASGIMALVRL
ncbi:MAG: exopolysaccharide biosynthesis protein [Hyphomicrobiales bacterium]